jgi:hypothetical protein
MALTATDIVDLANATLPDLGKMRVQNIAQNYVDYVVFGDMFKKERMEIESGKSIQRTLQYKISDSTRHVGLYATDVTNVESVTTTMSLGWCYATTNWSFDEHEVTTNAGSAMIFNIMLPRRNAAMLSMVEQIEQYAWTLPALAETTKPKAIPYWIVKNNTTGFNGGLPSGYSDVAGVNLTTVPTFKNYTAQYTTASKADLVAKLKSGIRRCGFKPPFPTKEYGNAIKFKFYTNETGIAAIETVGEAQNENLGRDIASMVGESVVIRRFPFVWVPQLDDDTTDPYYGINHDTFKVVVAKGWNMKQSKVIMSPTQHNVFTSHIDLTYNYLCVDRRRNMVIAKNT